MLTTLPPPGIPTEPQGGNHTRAFARSAASPEAHVACLNVSKTLAAVGVRVLVDDAYFAEVRMRIRNIMTRCLTLRILLQVRKTFEDDLRLREAERGR